MVAVAMILTAIAVPSFKGIMRMYKLRGTVSMLTGAIQSTRYRAISEGYPYQIVISKTGKTYQLQNDTSATRNGPYNNVGTAIPFTTNNDAVTLDVDTTLKLSPSGAIAATTGGTTFNLAYNGLNARVTVSPYGNIGVAYTP